MKSQRAIFKWFAASFLLAVLMGFALMSSTASAQEENTPTPTETSGISTPVPTETPSEEIPIPTITPTPMAEPEESMPSLSAQAAEQTDPSSTGWSTPVNISLTDSDSMRPSIAVDSSGGVHIVWIEKNSSGLAEIYYKYWDGTTWSTSINVSNSSLFDSNDPQVVADSNGRAHITWKEQDDDYAGDAEILYSRCTEGICTAPVSLSGPPNWDCGRYYPNLQDWYSEIPILGIDQADRLMVEWRAYEPGETTMPYSTWLGSGTPPSVRTGCVTAGTGVYTRGVGSSRIAGGATGDFRLLFEEARTDGTVGIYYSRYMGTRWTSSYLTHGHYPDVFLDTSNQAYGTWCGSDGEIRYWNSNNFATEIIPNTSCHWHSPIAVDVDGVPRVFWNQSGKIYETKHLPEGWSERVSISQNPGGAAGPDVVSDVNGYLHLVWYQSYNGNFEIFYSTNALPNRVPVILIPGLTGSRLYVSQDFTWSQPNGHDGNNYEHTYAADEEIWLNPWQLPLANDDYFDVLRLEQDGTTQSTNALYGVDLEARNLLDKVGWLDVYNNLLTDLQNKGYQPGVDLFTFPYDWRLDISGNAQLLDDVVLTALEKANGTKDRSEWKITQVDLIAHSMGASVAREYISYPTYAVHVHRMIAIGPVFLGAPKPLKSILFGDALVPQLDPNEAKDIVQNMPGAFQVSPGHAYWEFYDGTLGNPVVFQEKRDFDGDGQELGDLSYDQFRSMLFGLDLDPNLDWGASGRDINQTVYNMGENFHNRLDFSWDSGIPIPEVDLIVGTGLCSIGQYQSAWRVVGGRAGPHLEPVIHINQVNGDGTVPLFSASLYDPDRGIDHRGGANVYYVTKKYSNHPFLLSKEPIRQLVISLLTGDNNLPEGIIEEANVPKKCSGTTINVESPVELHVTDSEGHHTGGTTYPDTGGVNIEEDIPGSQYDDIEGTKSVYLPDDGEYTISLKSTGAGTFNVIIHLYKGDGAETTIVYLRVPLTTTTTGEMLFDTSSIASPTLQLDHDGDGVTDELVEATSVVGSAESTDIEPPQIEIIGPKQGQVLVGSPLVEWQSNDDISGVLNEWGFIDMGTISELLVSNGIAIELSPGDHTLTVLVEDFLGNASQEQVSFRVYPFEWLPPLTGSGTYYAKLGSTIPVKFSVRDLNGVFIRDQSVELNLLDSSGNVVAGPFVFAQNPTQGVAILGNTQYHHNLKTKGLIAGIYTLQVVFNSAELSGRIESSLILH